MYFNQIDLYADTVISLPKEGDLTTSKFLLKDVQGVGPTKRKVNLRNTLYQGGVYQGSNSELRQLVFRVGYNPDYFSGETVEQLREELYKLLMTEENDWIVVSFQDTVNSKARTALGYVSNIDPVIFSKDPDVQITIDCDSAYLKGDTKLFGGDDGEELPSNIVPVLITNDGTAPTGFRMEFRIIDPTSEFSISRNGSLQKMLIEYEFESNDVVVIDTRYGSRELTLIRDSEETSLLAYLADGYTWMKLLRGNNEFVIVSEDDIPNYDWVMISYQEQYWGI